MPEHNPEDRVSIKNIIQLQEDDIQTFTRTKYRTESITKIDGTQENRQREYKEEFQWNFKDGFFFAWGGQYYWLRPGQTKTYYRFIAEHAANKMADYLLTREYMATKTVDSDGVPHYANNILQNAQKRQSLLNRIIQGVEEWAIPDTDDFDAKLAREFGGDFDQAAKPLVNSADFMLNEVDQDSKPAKAVERAEVPPTDNPELKKAREEADLYQIVYTASDSADVIKKKILKAMA